MYGVYTTGCYTPSNLVFLVVIFPLFVFFALVGVFVLHRSRINQSANMSLCWKSMDTRQWKITLFYLFFELVVLLDFYFWLLAGISTPIWRFLGISLGIFFLVVVGCLAGCGLLCTRRPPAKEQAPANMDVVMVSDPSVHFYAAPVSVSGQPAPTAVVPGYPVSSGYYQATAPVAPVSAGDVFRYSVSDGVDSAVALTGGVAPSQSVHSDMVPSYQPPAYSPPAISTAAPVKTEDFQA